MIICCLRVLIKTIKFSFMEMTIVQWATILSPIIAVILAWWTCRSGARDTAKLVKCNKKLMQISLQIKMIELSKEAKEEHVEFSSLLKKAKEMSQQRHSNYPDWSSEILMQYEDKERDNDYKITKTFDKRMVITETMSDLINLIREVGKI